jgi:anti-sigma factor RsiW
VISGAIGALAASLALFALVPSGQSVEGQLIDAQARSLQAQHLVDVATSDRHTVKPWFNGRLDFSPPVVDAAAEGFPLVGGRLDYVDGRTVAALVYQRREHRVDLFAWPASGRAAEPLAVAERRGFNVLHWTRDGMRHWLVSDLEVAEMKRLAGLVAASEEK